MTDGHVSRLLLHAAAVRLERAFRVLLPDESPVGWKFTPHHLWEVTCDEMYYEIDECNPRFRPHVVSFEVGPEWARRWSFFAGGKGGWRPALDAMIEQVPGLRELGRELRRCRSLAKRIRERIADASREELQFAQVFAEVARTTWVVLHLWPVQPGYDPGRHSEFAERGPTHLAEINPPPLRLIDGLVASLSVPPLVEHSPDFATLTIGQTVYQFSARQRPVIRALVEAKKRGSPGVSQAQLLEASGSAGERLRDVFKLGGKTHPAWGLIVVRSAHSKDVYEFFPAEAPRNPQ